MALFAVFLAWIAGIFTSNWSQLAGHAGALIQGTTRRILKKMPFGDQSEALNYEEIMADPDLHQLTPKFFKQVDYKFDSFLEMEDLLWNFPNPRERFIMDLKLGSRYMKFRETQSTTATLGFRVDVAKMPNRKLSRDLKKICTREEVGLVFTEFFQGHQIQRQSIAKLLGKFYDRIKSSKFFQQHEIIGSSILLIFDSRNAGAWLIDFAKCTKVPDGMQLDHHSDVNTDGYLIGLGNLIQILEARPREQSAGKL